MIDSENPNPDRNPNPNPNPNPNQAPSAGAAPLLSAEDAAKPTLILSGAKLPTGIILVQVQGCIGTDCDTASATIQRFAAPVVAKVAGGNRNAGKASVMNFDCTESYWPDATAEEKLVYTWSLDKVGTPLP